MKKLKYLVILFLGITSCNQLIQMENLEPISEVTKTHINPEFKEYLVLLGFDNPDDLIIEDFEDYFLVNNYLRFSKDELKKELEILLNNDPNTLYRRTIFTPTTPFQKRIIKYKFQEGVPLSSRTKMIDAFNTWNNIRNFNIQFVNDQLADSGVILIKALTQSSSNWVEADVPSSLKPHGIGLNYRFDLMDIYLNNSKQKWVFINSIGVTIGLINESLKNNSYANLIPGTMNTDSYSIYYQPFLPGAGHPSSGNIPDWTGFPYTDLLGIRYLWPHDTTEKPLYSYVSKYTSWGHWTLNWNQYGYYTPEYLYWGVSGYIFTVQKPNTVPLYRYTNSNGANYLTLNSNLGLTYPSFTSNGIFGYVYNSPGPNRMPVYEWYHPNNGFFITTNFVDTYVQSQGMTGGSIAFYAVTLDY